MSSKSEFSIDFLTDPNIMYLAETSKFKYDKGVTLMPKDLCLFRVDEICSEEDAPQREALENVLSSMKLEGINFLFLIVGDEHGVNFYYGISKDLSCGEVEMPLSIADIGRSILKRSIQGNFRGSKVSDVGPDDKRRIINRISEMKYSGMLEGVPGSNKDDEEFQGTNRLVDVMLGDDFVFMAVAKPLSLPDILEIQSDMYSLYSKLSPLSKTNIQTSDGSSSGESKGITKGISKSSGKSDSTAVTNGTSDSISESTGTNKSHSKGTSTSSGGSSSSSGTSESGSEGSNTGHSSTVGKSYSKTDTAGISNSESTSESTQEGTNSSKSHSEALSREFLDKKVQDWIKYLDEVIFPRIDYGKGKGAFISSIALFAENPASLQKLQNTSVALYAGETGNRVPLKPVKMQPAAQAAIKNFQLPHGHISKISCENEQLAHAGMSQVISKTGEAYLGNWITTNELGVITGLPQKEVVGMCLRREVEFGLNVGAEIPPDERIELGNLVQSGNLLKNNVYLDKRVLDQHIFISGVTGSGKTTTCQKILQAADIPFLVIEPAKTEYRILRENYDDLLVFTLGKNDAAPFFLNPFVFMRHENITSRVDMIKACIEASFDMEAAIPQIIETAIYKCYEDYGWDISDNTNSRFEDPFAPGINAFPTLEDLIAKTTVVVNEQGFDDRLKNDYIGSIRARLMGLLVGSKGLMLNTQHSVDFEDLLEHRVVLELEEIRSGSEKSLIMGFVLTNLMAAIKEKYIRNGKFRHITLVEEAHRLLSKFMPGDSPNKRHGVEIFADMLAEIRKYGESLIIADQIPNKMTPEVLKNTNTKIIHRIFAEDDKDSIGNTVMLDKEQKEFLSNLEAGRAIFFSNGTEKALQVQIKQTFDTSRKAPDDIELVENAMNYYRRTYKTGALRGTELFTGEPTLEQALILHKLGSSGCIKAVFRSFTAKNTPAVSQLKKLREADKLLSRDILVEFIGKYCISDRYLSENPEEIPSIIGMILSEEELSQVQISEIQDMLTYK